MATLLIAGGGTPSSAAGQDPVSGHWLASVQAEGRSPEVVFVLQLDGARISGRRILPGQRPLDVRGEWRGSGLRMEFRVPEGGSHVEVTIEAEAEADRLTGTWVAVLPSGQRIERPWRAERTVSRDAPDPGR